MQALEANQVKHWPDLAADSNSPDRGHRAPPELVGQVVEGTGKTSPCQDAESCGIAQKLHNTHRLKIFSSHTLYLKAAEQKNDDSLKTQIWSWGT